MNPEQRQQSNTETDTEEIDINNTQHIRKTLGALCLHQHFDEYVTSPLIAKLAESRGRLNQDRLVKLWDSRLIKFSFVSSVKTYDQLFDDYAACIAYSVVSGLDEPAQILEKWNQSIETIDNAKGSYAERKRAAKIRKREAKIQKRLGKSSLDDQLRSLAINTYESNKPKLNNDDKTSIFKHKHVKTNKTPNVHKKQRTHNKIYRSKTLPSS